MARRRYVPKTYNNRRVLRLITGAAITIGLTFVILFIVLFFVFQLYVEEGQLVIPWLDGFDPPDRVPLLLSNEMSAPEDDIELTGEHTGDRPGATGNQPSDDNDTGDDDAQSDPEQSDSDQTDTNIAEKYTIEQIQAALEAQFAATAFGERNPQIISAEEVERDRDSINPESAGPDAQPVDLSNASRFKVEFRFEQPIEEFRIWEEPYSDEDELPFRRDGNHTIMTDYYYFNDVNGTPVLAFVKD